LTFLSFLSHTAGCLSDVRGQSVPGSRERKMGSNTVGASLQTLCVCVCVCACVCVCRCVCMCVCVVVCCRCLCVVWWVARHMPWKPPHKTVKPQQRLPW